MTVDELQDLEDAGLVYVSDEEPGHTRRRRGTGFSYHAPDGTVVPDDVRTWIESLAIPPAWTDVWICPDPNGHLLATGRDSEGRKQYRYHDTWTELRDMAKFDRMFDFGRRLRRVRGVTGAHLGLDGLPRERVLALVVRLMDETLIRVGSDRYAQTNGTYGLTTLTSDHVEVSGDTVRLEFMGKNAKPVDMMVANPRLAELVRRCMRLDAPELFAYTNERGEVVDVTSSDVNRYLRDISRIDCTAKDFRTWGATATVVEHLAGCDVADDRPWLEGIDRAAELLNNTRAVCRASYVHPDLESAFHERRLHRAWAASRAGTWYSRSESALLKLLDG